MRRLCLMLGACALLASASAGDTPQDYTHALQLHANARQGVLQLRLPRDAYLHARTPGLDDLRVFDANGVPQPFTLRRPTTETRLSRRDLPLTIFPLMGTGSNDKLDLDVSASTDGRLLSVKLRPEAGGTAQSQLAALLLDLGNQSRHAPVDALRFTPPAGTQAYSAQIWLETSDDMKQWDTVGAAELNWLINRDAQTLSNDRLTFDPRSFRYARLSWRSGKPLLFAAIVAEQAISTDTVPYSEQLLVQPAAGRQPQDLVYVVPPAIAPYRLGLEFGSANGVLAGTLGVYRELPARQPGQGPSWRFDSITSATFYRILQGSQVRSSGDLEVPPVHAAQWVLRSATPTSLRPALRLRWQPATLVFLANGTAPYTLAVGRANATTVAQSLEQVAPGFSEAELRALEPVSVGPAIPRQANAGSTADNGAELAHAARLRVLALWGVLLLGVTVLGFMVWRLVRPSHS